LGKEQKQHKAESLNYTALSFDSLNFKIALGIHSTLMTFFRSVMS